VDNYVFGKTLFYLKHPNTGLYLYTDNGSKYNEQNCHRCPIVGYAEISGAQGKTRGGIWKTHSGYFFPVTEESVYPDDVEDVEDYDFTE
jgi:hypothetical protein